jgi:heat-inducible transcriptional repressor
MTVSSATVRSVLARLEKAGYVRQPHTSAGRIPTDRAYRYYVDLLLRARRKPRFAAHIEARLREAGTVPALLDNASHELSRASHHVGFALAPVNRATLQQIEFASLGGSKVLVIVIARGGQITHKVVDAGERVSLEDLWSAARYLNTEFTGMALSEVRSAILQRLQEERTVYDALVARALALARSSLDEFEPQDTFFIQGASTLLDASQEEDGLSLDTLRVLFRMIEEKHRLVHLLNEYMEGPGLTVIIGSEHVAPDLQNFSLVASTYVDGDGIGTVGVIGPTRMRYARTIAAVDGMADTLQRVLEGPEDNPA